MVKRKLKIEESDYDNVKDKKLQKSVEVVDSENESEVSDENESSEFDEQTDEEEIENESEESDDGESDNESEEFQKNSKNKSNGHSSLSAEDIQQARETSELFKSNIFKLQIDELLKEIALKDKYTRRVDHVLVQINECLKQAESIAELDLKEAEKCIKPLSIPFSEPRPRDIKYKFGWKTPKSINVIGSYSLKTAVKQPEGTGIDLMIIMPEELFQEKDYLNFRYFHKRAFYLAYTAKLLHQAASDVYTLQYGFQSDEPLKPILRLFFKDKNLANKFHINIIPGISDGFFPSRKLDMDKNCIRMNEHNTFATTLYNSAVLSDCTHERYLKILHSASFKCEGFVDACKLGRLWLRQRGIGSSPQKGGFGHFEWSMLMAVLLNGGPRRGRVLSNGYSSYQLFKSTLQFLADHDLGSDKGILSFDETSTNLSNTQTVNLGFPVLQDKVSKLNILYKMSRWGYSVLRHEAAITGDLLHDVTKDRFEQVFLHPLKNHFKYDVRFNLIVPVDDELYSGITKIQYLSPIRFWMNRLYRLLTRGFGKRAHLVAFIDLAPCTESVFITNTVKGRSKGSHLTLSVGIVLNGEECDKILTLGPLADDGLAVKKFQSFWGKKSELRRFQNDAMREVVSWKSPFDKRTSPIVFQITEYLVNLHLTDVRIELEDSSSMVDSVRVGGIQYHQAKYASFQRMVDVLQKLDGIPLRIRSVYPTSSSLRYTSIDLPTPFEYKADDGVASGLIEFETSSKWPDDINALEKTKSAFLLRICREMTAFNSYTALIGTETDFLPGVEVGFLQIQSPEGYSFKLRIVTDFDVVLLNRLVASDPKNEKNKSLLEIYKRKYQMSVSHTRMIQTIALRYPYYSPSCRLLKMWFRRHLISSLFEEEAIEILALKPFVDSGPYLPSNDAGLSLLRILDFLSSWNWRIDPLVLDISNHKTADETKSAARATTITGTEMDLGMYQRCTNSFEKLRESDPALTLAPMALFISTDPTGITWTKQIPRSDVGRVTASRISGLAKAAMMLPNINYGEIFAPSFADYDIVIDLSSEHEKRKIYKNLQIHNLSREEIIDNSVDIKQEFCKDLQRRFVNTLVFFYGDSNRVCGVWHKDVTEPRKFKVSLEYSTIPVDAQNVELNKSAIIEEIRRIGGDLVVDINVK